ncbi:hypothetical protein DL768_003926 [Monosporascus sp. mg162]|nr:hypothetical protein DL768_003926 [Monosporascus sp. mg162]
MKVILLELAACQVVLYCGAEHQRADRPFHKTSCSLIKKARPSHERERGGARGAPGRRGDPRAPVRGRARPVLVLVGHAPLHAAVSRPHVGDTERAHGRGGRGRPAVLPRHAAPEPRRQPGREQVPALYMRLGRDQEAFDFLKWWGAEGKRDDYDWTDADLPYLNLQGEDAFEEPLTAWGSSREASLSFVVSMINLKLRLLLDMRGLQQYVEANPGKGYDEKMAWVREEAIGDVLYRRRDIVERVDYKDLVDALQKQVAALYDRVDELNKYYWPALHHPERYSHAAPTIYTHGSPEEVILAFRYTWYSWGKCEQAIDFVKCLKA